MVSAGGFRRDRLTHQQGWWGYPSKGTGLVFRRSRLMHPEGCGTFGLEMSGITPDPDPACSRRAMARRLSDPSRSSLELRLL